MTKADAVNKLKSTLAKLQQESDYIDVSLTCSYKERPKCPKCGEYEGDNFVIYNFLYYSEKCNKCNHHYSES